MYKKQRKLHFSKKSIIFFVAIFIVLIVLITGIVMITTKSKELKDSVVDLPFSSNSEYFPVGNTIVYADNELLTCVDTALNTVWQLKLYTGGLRYTANDDVIAAAGDNIIQVVKSDGSFLFQTQLEGTIQSVRLAKDKVAVNIDQVLTDKTLSYIIVFDLAGNSLFQLDISSQYVMDYGFDSSSERLYILELDVSGAAPVSKISTYRPETQSMTGNKEFKDQLIECILMIDDEIYTIGTNHLIIYTSFNSNDIEIMTYGWMLEDIFISSDPQFIFVPNTSNHKIDAIRAIRKSGDETTINLPPGVFSVINDGEKIYCFATSKVFVYTDEGKYLRTYDLPFSIDQVEKATDGYVFITSDETISLLPLP